MSDGEPSGQWKTPRVTASSFTPLWQSDVLNLEEDQTPGEIAVGQLEFGLRWCPVWS